LPRAEEEEGGEKETEDLAEAEGGSRFRESDNCRRRESSWLLIRAEASSRNRTDSTSTAELEDEEEEEDEAGDPNPERELSGADGGDADESAFSSDFASTS